MTQNPTAFVSYSWDSEPHKAWVRDLATRLRADGVAAALDQWETVPGDQLPAYMERAIRENEFVLVVCTPRYKARSDRREGGVGYEGDIMTAEIAQAANHRKFIPVWRNGTWHDAAPSWLLGKYRVDLTGTPYSEEQYADLLSTLLGTRPAAPPLGVPPSKRRTGVDVNPVTPLPNSGPEDPVRIVGVIVDQVSTPKMDGTRGSALYSVPFRLSRLPSAEWAELFRRNWEQPPRWTTRHRPGIGRVEGNRIVLDGTTLEEIESTHRQTLKLVLDKTNEQEALLLEERRRQEQVRQEREAAHRSDVEARAKRLKFD